MCHPGTSSANIIQIKNHSNEWVADVYLDSPSLAWLSPDDSSWLYLRATSALTWDMGRARYMNWFEGKTNGERCAKSPKTRYVNWLKGSVRIFFHSFCLQTSSHVAFLGSVAICSRVKCDLRCQWRATFYSAESWDRMQDTNVTQKSVRWVRLWREIVMRCGTI
jgi:hypothetical protein